MLLEMEILSVQEIIKQLQKNFECPICLELMSNPVSTKCSHEFCNHCLLEAIKNKPTALCPMCKEPFTKRSLKALPGRNQMVSQVRALSTAFKADTEGSVAAPTPIKPTAARKRSESRSSNQEVKGETRPGPREPSPQPSTSTNGITRPSRKNTRVVKHRTLASRSCNDLSITDKQTTAANDDELLDFLANATHSQLGARHANEKEKHSPHTVEDSRINTKNMKATEVIEVDNDHQADDVNIVQEIPSKRKRNQNKGKGKNSSTVSPRSALRSKSRDKSIETVVENLDTFESSPKNRNRNIESVVENLDKFKPVDKIESADDGAEAVENKSRRNKKKPHVSMTNVEHTSNQENRNVDTLKKHTRASRLIQERFLQGDYDEAFAETWEQGSGQKAQDKVEGWLDDMPESFSTLESNFDHTSPLLAKMRLQEYLSSRNSPKDDGNMSKNGEQDEIKTEVSDIDDQEAPGRKLTKSKRQKKKLSHGNLDVLSREEEEFLVPDIDMVDDVQKNREKSPIIDEDKSKKMRDRGQSSDHFEPELPDVHQNISRGNKERPIQIESRSDVCGKSEKSQTFHHRIFKTKDDQLPGSPVPSAVFNKPGTPNSDDPYAFKVSQHTPKARGKQDKRGKGRKRGARSKKSQKNALDIVFGDNGVNTTKDVTELSVVQEDVDMENISSKRSSSENHEEGRVHKSNHADPSPRISTGKALTNSAPQTSAVFNVEVVPDSESLVNNEESVKPSNKRSSACNESEMPHPEPELDEKRKERSVTKHQMLKTSKRRSGSTDSDRSGPAKRRIKSSEDNLLPEPDLFVTPESDDNSSSPDKRNFRSKDKAGNAQEKANTQGNLVKDESRSDSRSSDRSRSRLCKKEQLERDKEFWQEVEMQSMVDKISQAEEFELVLSQQFRDMQSNERKKKRKGVNTKSKYTKSSSVVDNTEDELQQVSRDVPVAHEVSKKKPSSGSKPNKPDSVDENKGKKSKPSKLIEDSQATTSAAERQQSGNKSHQIDHNDIANDEENIKTTASPRIEIDNPIQHSSPPDPNMRTLIGYVPCHEDPKEGDGGNEVMNKSISVLIEETGEMVDVCVENRDSAGGLVFLPQKTPNKGETDDVPVKDVPQDDIQSHGDVENKRQFLSNTESSSVVPPTAVRASCENETQGHHLAKIENTFQSPTDKSHRLKLKSPFRQSIRPSPGRRSSGKDVPSDLNSDVSNIPDTFMKTSPLPVTTLRRGGRNRQEGDEMSTMPYEQENYDLDEDDVISQTNSRKSRERKSRKTFSLDSDSPLKGKDKADGLESLDMVVMEAAELLASTLEEDDSDVSKYVIETISQSTVDENDVVLKKIEDSAVSDIVPPTNVASANLTGHMNTNRKSLRNNSIHTGCESASPPMHPDTGGEEKINKSTSKEYSMSHETQESESLLRQPTFVIPSSETPPCRKQTPSQSQCKSTPRGRTSKPQVKTPSSESKKKATPSSSRSSTRSLSIRKNKENRGSESMKPTISARRELDINKETRDERTENDIQPHAAEIQGSHKKTPNKEKQNLSYAESGSDSDTSSDEALISNKHLLDEEDLVVLSGLTTCGLDSPVKSSSQKFDSPVKSSRISEADIEERPHCDDNLTNNKGKRSKTAGKQSSQNKIKSKRRSKKIEIIEESSAESDIPSCDEMPAEKQVKEENDRADILTDCNQKVTNDIPCEAESDSDIKTTSVIPNKVVSPALDLIAKNPVLKNLTKSMGNGNLFDLNQTTEELEEILQQQLLEEDIPVDDEFESIPEVTDRKVNKKKTPRAIQIKPSSGSHLRNSSIGITKRLHLSIDTNNIKSSSAKNLEQRNCDNQDLSDEDVLDDLVVDDDANDDDASDDVDDDDDLIPPTQQKESKISPKSMMSLKALEEPSNNDKDGSVCKLSESEDSGDEKGRSEVKKQKVSSSEDSDEDLIRATRRRKKPVPVLDDSESDSESDAESISGRAMNVTSSSAISSQSEINTQDKEYLMEDMSQIRRKIARLEAELAAGQTMVEDSEPELNEKPRHSQPRSASERPNKKKSRNSRSSGGNCARGTQQKENQSNRRRNVKPADDISGSREATSSDKMPKTRSQSSDLYRRLSGGGVVDLDEINTESDEDIFGSSPQPGNTENISPNRRKVLPVKSRGLNGLNKNSDTKSNKRSSSNNDSQENHLTTQGFPVVCSNTEKEKSASQMSTEYIKPDSVGDHLTKSSEVQIIDPTPEQALVSSLDNVQALSPSPPPSPLSLQKRARPSARGIQLPSQLVKIQKLVEDADVDRNKAPADPGHEDTCNIVVIPDTDELHAPDSRNSLSSSNNSSGKKRKRRAHNSRSPHSKENISAQKRTKKEHRANSGLTVRENNTPSGARNDSPVKDRSEFSIKKQLSYSPSFKSVVSANQSAPSSLGDLDLVFPQHPDWSFVASGISKTLHMPHIHAFLEQTGAKFGRNLTEQTTHVLVKPDCPGSRRCQRTLKYFQAIAYGKWVLSVEWIVMSMKRKQLLPMEAYEIVGDMMEKEDHCAPQRARNSRFTLLRDYEICFCGAFQDLTIDDLRDLVEKCGGVSINHPSDFSEESQQTRLVIVESQNASKVPNLRRFPSLYGCTIVSKEWLLDSIGTYNIETDLDAYSVDLR